MAWDEALASAVPVAAGPAAVRGPERVGIATRGVRQEKPTEVAGPLPGRRS
ncbi:hypothetical protein [Streptomyces incarnatus]|uniref:hypothetical protein n=1 Tax=Streptomyces incarnatus TaxID=665007 RepID=UPI000AB3EC0A|nr:hypothetical protein [Streptomyces incarnatus]